MTATAAEQSRPVKLFGRKVGRPLSPAMQQDLATLSVRYGLGAAAIRQDTAHPVYLEIGCGSGEFLIRQAQSQPEARFWGLEPFVNGALKTLRGLHRAGIENARLSLSTAQEFLPMLPSACLDGAFVLFPDPWPKRRHHKRRLITPVWFTDMARVLKPAASLTIASDHPGYTAWILKCALDHADFHWPAQSAAHWLRTPSTRYEAKADTPCATLRLLRAS